MANKRNKWRRLYASCDTFVCPYCLKKLPFTEATKNFVPPISRPKLGTPHIVPTCRKCNQEKGALSDREYKRWKKEKDFYTWVRLEEIRNGIIK